MSRTPRFLSVSCYFLVFVLSRFYLLKYYITFSVFLAFSTFFKEQVPFWVSVFRWRVIPGNKGTSKQHSLEEKKLFSLLGSVALWVFVPYFTTTFLCPVVLTVYLSSSVGQYLCCLTIVQIRNPAQVSLETTKLSTFLDSVGKNSFPGLYSFWQWPSKIFLGSCPFICKSSNSGQVFTSHTTLTFLSPPSNALCDHHSLLTVIRRSPSPCQSAVSPVPWKGDTHRFREDSIRNHWAVCFFLHISEFCICSFWCLPFTF